MNDTKHTNSGGADSLDFLAAGEAARLFPVLSESSREGRALSILLSCMRFVPLFGRTLIAELGHKLGSRSQLDTYTEVTLKRPVDTRSGLRPDGLIVVRTGNRQQWSALVEAKVRGAKLDNSQIASYLDLAKANGINAVVTFSNDFATTPSHHPTYAARLPSGVLLYHLSWTSILTHARLLLANDDLDDADHRLLLAELVRFLDHKSTGVLRFDRMPPSWKDLVTSVMAGATPHRASEQVMDAVASWHQETRDLALRITQMVNAKVAIKMQRKYVGDPRKRVADEAAKLSESARLTAEFDVPSAAAPISIEADLRRRTISVSMKLDAPGDRASTKARVNWLLRQVQKSEPNDIHIVAHWPRQSPVQDTLSDVRRTPDVLDSPTAKGAPAKNFTVMLVRDAAARFAGNRSFVAELEEAVPRFYEQIGQRLKAWRPAAPQVRAASAVDTVPPQAPATGHTDPAHPVDPASSLHEHLPEKDPSQNAAEDGAPPSNAGSAQPNQEPRPESVGGQPGPYS